MKSYQPESTHYTHRTDQQNLNKTKLQFNNSIIEEREEIELETNRQLNHYNNPIEYNDHPLTIKNEEERLHDEKKNYNYIGDENDLLELKKKLFNISEIHEQSNKNIE